MLCYRYTNYSSITIENIKFFLLFLKTVINCKLKFKKTVEAPFNNLKVITTCISHIVNDLFLLPQVYIK